MLNILNKGSRLEEEFEGVFLFAGGQKRRGQGCTDLSRTTNVLSSPDLPDSWTWSVEVVLGFNP